jgi:tryptophan halogenase
VPGESYIHSFGSVGRGVGLIPFRQLWLRGRGLGVAGDLGDYSVNVAAARRGRMDTKTGDMPSLPDVAYAYHFDATLVARMLRDYAEARGVVRVEGMIERVERDGQNGDISALRLNGDRRVDGSFFFDCTGFRSLLLGDALKVPFEDWSHYLPCDRAIAVPCASSQAFRPYTQSIAHQAGWQWRIPLQSRTGNGHVFCSSFMDEEQARSILLDNLDGEVLAEPRTLRFTTGHREPWSQNCLALGLAAGFMEPLESTSIHLVQSALARFLNLFPNAPADPAPARTTFNRLSRIEWERVRDFLVLHYVANERAGEPFWDACRAMDIPATLAEKIALFKEAGLFVREEDELFLDDSWGQVMIGQGIMPRSWSPLADNVPANDIAPFLKSVADGCVAKAERMPAHRAFVERIVA